MKKKKEIQIKAADWRVSVTAITALTILEIFAIIYGINGTFRTIIFSAICLIAGIHIQKEKLNIVMGVKR